MFDWLRKRLAVRGYLAMYERRWKTFDLGEKYIAIDYTFKGDFGISVRSNEQNNVRIFRIELSPKNEIIFFDPGEKNPDINVILRDNK